MTVRTITITDDAYGRLAALKREGESFSDVIRRITRRTPLLELKGALSPKAGERVARSVRGVRGEINARVRRSGRGLTR